MFLTGPNQSTRLHKRANKSGTRYGLIIKNNIHLFSSDKLSVIENVKLDSSSPFKSLVFWTKSAIELKRSDSTGRAAVALLLQSSFVSYRDSVSP